MTLLHFFPRKGIPRPRAVALPPNLHEGREGHLPRVFTGIPLGSEGYELSMNKDLITHIVYALKQVVLYSS